MIYFQMHEHHGRHMAHTPTEERENIKNGWRTVTKDEFYAEANGIDRGKLIADYTSLFGKAPPKNMTSGTLQSKINAEIS